MRIYQLIYRSQANQLFTEADLIQLLQTARAKNASQKITGLLLYGYDTFLQVLEGKEDVVINLFFEKISKDLRHNAVKILSQGFVEQRQFKEWSMAFRTINPEQMAELLGYQNPETEKDGQSSDLLLPLRMMSFMHHVSQSFETDKG